MRGRRVEVFLLRDMWAGVLFLSSVLDMMIYYIAHIFRMCSKLFTNTSLVNSITSTSTKS